MLRCSMCLQEEAVGDRYPVGGARRRVLPEGQQVYLLECGWAGHDQFVDVKTLKASERGSRRG